MPIPDKDVQQKAVLEVCEMRTSYGSATSERRQTLTNVYRAWSSFEQEQEENWSTSFKVNKAHEIVEKVLPRIVAKNPRWLVSVRDEGAFPEALKPMAADLALFIQDYLTYIWDEYNLIDNAKHWAKSMILYGKAYARVGYKYEVAFLNSEGVEEVVDEEGNPQMDEEGEIVTRLKDTIEEKVVGEYPTIEVRPWTSCYYDPRFYNLKDRPCFIDEVEGVRVSQLDKMSKREENPYFNVSKIKSMGLVDKGKSDQEYIAEIRAIAGFTDITMKEGDRVDLNNLKVTRFQGYFNKGKDPVDEKLYEIVIVNDIIVVQFKEITQIEYEEIKCFSDPETAFARGFVEPIMSLQDELNFKKNSASEYINKALTRQVIYSDKSGIDPTTINDPVVVTEYDAQTAAANFVELAKPNINPSYFQEQNDFERQIQSASFTVDTANPRSDQALTNTATGIRIKFFESNSVIDEVRKNFELGLQNIAYKMLQCAFENMDDNIVLKKQGTEEFWEANKEVLRDAITRYTIRVEVNSSAYDFIENRREERLALYNALVQAKAQGEPVNTTAALKDLLETFESLDTTRYLQPTPQQVAQEMRPIPTEGVARQAQQSPEQLTEQVAQGNLQV